MNIPAIDLDKDPGVRLIGKACRAAGCFRVTTTQLDHGVTQKLLDCMSEFFSLPDNHPVKLASHRNQNAGASGWTPMLEEPAYEPGTVSWVESFDCGLSREAIAQLPRSGQAQVHPSIWPGLPGFRESVRVQWDRLVSMAQGVFPLVSGMLKQDPAFLANRASSQQLNTMRLLNYPPRPDGDDGVSRGISAHTDFECITLIYQTAPGLEVRTPAGDWLQVPADPGQWTVLLGDVIERWSNGHFKATPHRVPVTRWPRQSIVMFMAADAGLEIRPLDEFVSPDNPAAFQTATQEGLIDNSMARAEANRLEMLPEAERLRAEINPG